MVAVAEWESAGPPGGGGVNALVAAKGNDLFQAYDVGGIQHIPADHPELAHKCNAGLANRHVASLSRTPSGQVLAGMGTIGPSGNGAQIFDPATHRWGTQLNGSRFIALHSQNSNPTDGGWPAWGIGHRYVRSTGELLALDEDTDTLTGGEFGFSATAIGVTRVDVEGAPRTVKGTEQWAVRNLIQHDTDRETVLVSTWPGGMFNSPRGLWRITGDDTVTRLLDKGVEAAAQRGSNIVAVTRTEGIWLSTDDGKNWGDISANAPKGTWWRCVNLLKNGTILIGGCFPVSGWAWARRTPTAANPDAWENLSANVDNRDLTSGQAFVPPNSGNRMGGPGCTIIATKHVKFQGVQVPACSGAGGVAWLYLDGKCRPMAYGGGIVVNRDVIATPDGQHIILAMMDHKVQVSHDAGLTWEKEATGLGGPNDFNAVGFDGNSTFFARGDDGSNWEAPITDNLRWKSSTRDARKYNPASSRIGGSGNVVTVDGTDVADGALERFGASDIQKRHLTGGYLWIVGHGAIRLPVGGGPTE